MPEVLKTFGDTVRTLRKNLSLTQEQLAEACDRHPVYISKLERGTKNPTLDSIIRIAAALQVQPGNLLDRALGEKENGWDLKKRVAAVFDQLLINRQKHDDLVRLILAFKSIEVAETKGLPTPASDPKPGLIENDRPKKGRG